MVPVHCSSVLPALSTVAGSDYNAISNLRLEFVAAGDVHLVNVTIINDNIFETFQESFSVTLTLDSPSLPAIIIFPLQAEVTIEAVDGKTVV